MRLGQNLLVLIKKKACSPLNTPFAIRRELRLSFEGRLKIPHSTMTMSKTDNFNSRIVYCVTHHDY